MSRRIMADGRPYDQSSTTKVRVYHRPTPDDHGRCQGCNGWIYWVTNTRKGPGAGFWRHEPDTFWTSR